jgi:hypothetical protein
LEKWNDGAKETESDIVIDKNLERKYGSNRPLTLEGKISMLVCRYPDGDHCIPNCLMTYIYSSLQDSICNELVRSRLSACPVFAFRKEDHDDDNNVVLPSNMTPGTIKMLEASHLWIRRMICFHISYMLT